MAKEWLNVFVDHAQQSPSTQHLDARDTAQIDGKAVRLYESDRSGSVTWFDGVLPVYGDAEVYLKINFSKGGFRYLSAPLHTPLDVSGVESLELHVLVQTGPTGWHYHALVNGHCIYEVI
jgi:hypothetical protein